MRKYRLYFTNISKEETWINQITAQGYHLKKIVPFLGQYEFEKIDSAIDNPASEKPSKTENFLPQVRIDFRIFSKQKDFTDYLNLFEDYGWRHITGTKSSGFQYFEQTHPDCDDEIFSDTFSRAGCYRRISNFWLESVILFLPLLIMFSSNGRLIPDFQHWKEWYFTPGLWEMSGRNFWAAFLFETPFALGRGLSAALFLILLICYGYFGLKAFYYYQKEKRS